MDGSLDIVESEDDTKRHDDAMESYKRLAEREYANHKHQREAIEFAEGRGQWPEEVRKAREGRPCLTMNRIPAAINGVINNFRKNAPQIKVRPLDNSADVQTAKMLGGLIRNIEDQSQANQIYETQGKLMTIGGWGVLRVEYDRFDPDGFDADLRIVNTPEPLNWICGAYTQPDASDAEEWFGVKEVNREQYEAVYDSVEDWQAYCDEQPEDWSNDDKVRICEHWYKKSSTKTLVRTPDGQVFDASALPPEQLLMAQQSGAEMKEVPSFEIWRAVMDGCKDLSNEKWPGSLFPIVAVIGNELMIDAKMVRYGMVKDAMDPQRQYNYQRTSQTEKIALGPKAPYIGPEDAFEGNETIWGMANTANHAYLPYRGDIAPQRNVTDTVSAGEVQAAQMAVDDLVASFGAPTNGDLGDPRDAVQTVLLRKRDESTAVFQYSDNLARAVQALGRVLLDLIPRVYTNARWVRIKGEDDKTQAVQLNTQSINPETGEQTLYDLSRGKYDVTATVGSSFATKREEGAQAVMQLMAAIPPAAMMLAPTMLKLVDFPGSDELAQKAEAMAAQEQSKGPPPDPAQAAMQIENAKTQSQMQINQAKSQADMQMLQAKTQSEAQAAQAQDQRAMASLQFEARLKLDTQKQSNDLEIAKAHALLQIEAVKKDQTNEISQLQQQVNHLASLVQQLTTPNQASIQ